MMSRPGEMKPAPRITVDSGAMAWGRSPAAGIWRKRLAHSGGAEDGPVTSIVRYDPGARFPAHDHPGGEEILVLEGVFSDEHGDYPAGGYLLHPEGFRHHPFSRGGCVLFVKLGHYTGGDRRHVTLDCDTIPWQPFDIEKVSIKPLYNQPPYPETVLLFKLEPGAKVPLHEHATSEEALVLDGSIEDEFGRVGPGTWLRYPPGSSHAPFSTDGCTLYVKIGGGS